MNDNSPLFLQALMQLARVDGEVDNEEVLMARAYARVHGIPDATVSQCLEDLPSVEATLDALSEVSEEDMTRFFWHAVDMVLLDQEMTVEEAHLLGLYGAIAGLHPGTWDLKDDGEYLLWIPYMMKEAQ